MRNVADLWFLYIFFLVVSITGCEQRKVEAEIPSKELEGVLDTNNIVDTKPQERKGSEQQSLETEGGKQKEVIKEPSTPETFQGTDQKEQPLPSSELLTPPSPLQEGERVSTMPKTPPADEIPEAPQGKGKGGQPVQPKNLGEFSSISVNNLPPPIDISTLLPPPPMDMSTLPPPPGMDTLPPLPGMDTLPPPPGMDTLPPPLGMDTLPPPPGMDILPPPLDIPPPLPPRD